MSRIYHLYDKRSGRKLAVCHAYVAPDGSILGSGKLDPKAIFDGGVMYIAKK